MITLKSKWAVQLEGDAEQIDELERVLNQSVSFDFEPFIIPVLSCKAIACAGWDILPDAQTVFSHAAESMRVIFGCLYLSDGGSPLTLGTVFGFIEDNTVTQTRITTVHICGRLAENDRITPMAYKNRLNALQKHSSLANCVSHLKPDSSWFDIFKAIEELESFYGGERIMLNDPKLDTASLKRAKRMANSYRHAGSVHRPPAKVLTLTDTANIIRSALDVILSNL